MSQTIRFNYLDRRLLLKRKEQLKAHVENIFKKEGRQLAELRYVFCSDEYLLSINQSFLKHDFYTDIITFDLTEPGEKKIYAEIYISLDRVKDNASQLNLSFEEEILRVVFHGALHLCGYKDKTKKELAIMREKETHYIKSYSEHFK